MSPSDSRSSARYAARAQQQRIFVSATGSDTNPCSFPQPCRSFQHAHDVAPGNGEIDVLDPAGYGALTITKSISIQGHGFSGITVGTTGVTISGAGVTVNLRGLLIDGGEAPPFKGFTGIAIQNNAVVHVQECLIRNLFFGILANGNGGSLFVSNTVISDNVNGINLDPSGSGTYTASLDRIDVDNNSGNGINADGVTNNFTGFMAVTLANSMVAKSGTGISVAALGPTVNVMVTNSSVVDGNIGLAATNSYAVIRLNQSTIAHNATGYTISNGGTVSSYHNNVFDDNFNNGDTAPPVLAVEEPALAG